MHPTISKRGETDPLRSANRISSDRSFSGFIDVPARINKKDSSLCFDRHGVTRLDQAMLTCHLESVDTVVAAVSRLTSAARHMHVPHGDHRDARPSLRTCSHPSTAPTVVDDLHLSPRCQKPHPSHGRRCSTTRPSQATETEHPHTANPPLLACLGSPAASKVPLPKRRI